jgi:hypothetical protein
MGNTMLRILAIAKWTTACYLGTAVLTNPYREMNGQLAGRFLAKMGGCSIRRLGHQTINAVALASKVCQ